MLVVLLFGLYFLHRLKQANSDLEKTVTLQKDKITTLEKELKQKKEEIKLQKEKLDELKSILQHVNIKPSDRQEPVKQDNKKRLGVFACTFYMYNVHV